MRCILVLVLVILHAFVGTRAEADCSTFAFRSDGGPILAHNFDYPQELQEGLLFINYAGAVKFAWRSNFMNGWMPDPNSEQQQWIAKYGSVTFNLPGYQMVSAGMNSEGLSVATMELKESNAPTIIDRPHIEGTVWLQFLLDTCADVEDVMRNSQRFSVDTFAHFLFADANGHTAIIEWVDGRMVISVGSNSNCVLTNSTLANSEQSYTTIRKELPVAVTPDRWRQERIEPNDWTRSLERFCILRDALERRVDRTRSPVDFAFDTLGLAKYEDPDRPGDTRTQWSLVFDIKSRAIHFETRLHPQRRTIEFSAIDFEQNREPMMHYIQSTESGSIIDRFINYDRAASRIYLETFTKAFCDYNQISAPSGIADWTDRTLEHLEKGPVGHRRAEEAEAASGRTKP